MINTLERLAILVVAVVGLVFIYGTLSMAWAGCEGAQYKWALYIASTKNYEYTDMFTSYQQCADTGNRNAAHYDGNGNPLYECRLVVKDH